MPAEPPEGDRITPETTITPKHPAIMLQTSNRFADSDEGYGYGDLRTEATRHGREAVRVWRETVPDDIKPYCHLQMEVRRHGHAERYEAYRRVLAELEEAEIPADVQIADPHDEYVFDPIYVEKLLAEFSCIKIVAITENRFEHYSDYNVPRYATPPHVRYAVDILHMAARHGKHVVISLQDLKWMHVLTDELNRPLEAAVRKYGDYCIPVSEHIGPRHIQRVTSIWGSWIAGDVRNWGIEPQSWWFENGRMIEPGVFGQSQPDNTRIMPPDLYRAMILQGAMMGATVYNFEPFWDLFDYDNAHCWRDVIYPTLMEVIAGKYIPEREQVLEKTNVAFQLNSARTITEFHENLRDVDWIGDEGRFVRAAYGLWSRYLEHELVPNKGRHFFIPLLGPGVSDKALERFEEIVRPGQCDTVAGYEELLANHYPPDGNDAFVTSINGHTYVMQTHANLYERQSYTVELPKPVSGLTAKRSESGVRLEWSGDPGASTYHIRRVAGAALPNPRGYSACVWHGLAETRSDPQLQSGESVETKSGAAVPEFGEQIPPIGTTTKTAYLDKSAEPGRTYSYTVTASTITMARKTGTVNYLDFVVFSETESVPGEWVCALPDGRLEYGKVEDPPDERPVSQVVHPLFDGAEGAHRTVAEEIVAALDAFKDAYDSWDYPRVLASYSGGYEDANGYHKEYVGWAWKWWFTRNVNGVMLRQIRQWDFSNYAESGEVRVKLFSLFRAVRYDDQPFGYGYDGTLRIPRHADEEVVYTWRKEEDGAWRIVHTQPSLPNMAEILWNSRGCDQTYLRLRPGMDDETPFTLPADE